MEAMDVLRTLALRQIPLRPGELEVDLAVERLLRHGHADRFDEPPSSPGTRVQADG